MPVLNKPILGASAKSDAIFTSILLPLDTFPAGTLIMTNGNDTYSPITLPAVATEKVYGIAGNDARVSPEGVWISVLTEGHGYAKNDPAAAQGAQTVATLTCINPVDGADVAGFLVKIG